MDPAIYREWMKSKGCEYCHSDSTSSTSNETLGGTLDVLVRTSVQPRINVLDEAFSPL